MAIKHQKIFSLFISLVLIFEQSGASAQVNTGAFSIPVHPIPASDTFRPIHLRYLSYNDKENNFRLLLDKDKTDNPSRQEIQSTSKELLKYFLIGVALPNDTFWVNLRPDSGNNIIDERLARTDMGRIMLETDIQLKKDLARMTSPETKQGKEYWERLYKKAEEIYGNEKVSIPTLTRPWIVPGEIILRETADSAYIYKATLKVMLEQDYLKSLSAYGFADERSKALNEYSSQLIRELIIPQLTKAVNCSKRYANLRQVYYSLIMAQWFKTRFKGRQGSYYDLINSGKLSGLTSRSSWSKDTYFEQYRRSFQDGEYNIRESTVASSGQVVRNYCSGGENFSSPDLNKALIGEISDSVTVVASNVFHELSTDDYIDIAVVPDSALQDGGVIKKDGMDLSKFISYMRLKAAEGAKIDYENLFDNAKQLKLAVDGFNGKPARLDTLTKQQTSYQRQAAVELIANGVDAVMPPEIVSTGRFGIGALQSLAELDDREDYVQWETTQEAGKGHRVTVTKGEAPNAFLLDIGKAVRSERGTRVRVFKKNFSRESQKKLEDYIRDKFSLCYRTPISINGKQINNDLSGVVSVDSGPLRFISQKEVKVTIDDHGYAVDDPGIGMGAEVVLGKLLLPGRGQKNLPSVQVNKEKIVKQTRLLYICDKVGPGEKIKSRISLQVSGVNIESFAMDGFTLAKEVVIELPPDTPLTEDRQHVQLTPQALEAIKMAVSKVMTVTDIAERSKLINTFAFMMAQMIKRDEQGLELLQFLINQVTAWRVDLARSGSYCYLPNQQGFSSLVPPQNLIPVYLDDELIQFELKDFPGARKIDNGGPGSSEVWVIKFKDDRVYFEFKDKMILAQHQYELNKSNPANLRLTVNPLPTDYEPAEKRPHELANIPAEKGGGQVISTIGAQPVAFPPQSVTAPAEPQTAAERGMLQVSVAAMPTGPATAATVIPGFQIISQLPPDIAAMVNQRIVPLCNLSSTQMKDVSDWLKALKILTDYFPRRQAVRDIVENYRMKLLGSKTNFLKIKRIRNIKPSGDEYIQRENKKLTKGKYAGYSVYENSKGYICISSPSSPNEIILSQVCSIWNTLFVLPNGNIVGASDEYHETIIINPDTGKELLYSRSDPYRPSFAILPDGNLVIYGYLGPEKIVIIDSETGKEIFRIEGRNACSINALVSGDLIFADHGDDSLVIIDPYTNEEIARFKNIGVKEPLIENVSPDGNLKVHKFGTGEYKEIQFDNLDATMQILPLKEPEMTSIFISAKKFVDNRSLIFRDKDRLSNYLTNVFYLPGHLDNVPLEDLNIYLLCLNRDVLRLVTPDLISKNKARFPPALSAKDTFLDALSSLNLSGFSPAEFTRLFQRLLDLFEKLDKQNNKELKERFLAFLKDNSISLRRETSFADVKDPFFRVFCMYLSGQVENMLQEEEPTVARGDETGHISDLPLADVIAAFDSLLEGVAKLSSLGEYKEIMKKVKTVYKDTSAIDGEIARNIAGQDASEDLFIREDVQNSRDAILLERQAAEHLRKYYERFPNEIGINESKLSQILPGGISVNERKNLIERIYTLDRVIAVKQERKKLPSLFKKLQGGDPTCLMFARQLENEYKKSGLTIRSYIPKGKKEWVLSFWDPCGMDLKTILGPLLVPSESTKIDSNSLEGILGIGFYTNFADADEVRIITGTGNGILFTLRILRQGGRFIIKDFIELKGDYKGTLVERVKKLNESCYLDSIFAEYNLLRYASAVRDVDILYNNKKINESLALAGIARTSFGEVRIFRSDSRFRRVTRNHLFVEYPKPEEYLALIPRPYFQNLLPENFVIDLPKRMPLVRSRMTISDKEKNLPVVQKSLSSIAMEKVLNAFYKSGTIVPGLSEDYFSDEDMTDRAAVGSAARNIEDDGALITGGKSEQVDFSRYIILDGDSDSVKERKNRSLKYLMTFIGIPAAQGNLTTLAQIRNRVLEITQNNRSIQPEKVVTMLGLEGEGISKYVIDGVKRINNSHKRPPDTIVREDNDKALTDFALLTRTILALCGLTAARVSFYSNDKGLEIARFGNNKLEWNLHYAQRLVDGFAEILRGNGKNEEAFYEEILHIVTHEAAHSYDQGKSSHEGNEQIEGLFASRQHELLESFDKKMVNWESVVDRVKKTVESKPDGGNTLLQPNNFREMYEIWSKEESQANDQRNEKLKDGGQTGGIDFRSLPIVNQAMNELRAKMAVMPVEKDFNPDKELIQLQKMVKSEITPSAERIGHYVRAYCLKGEIAENREGILLCIASILRQEEAKSCATDPVLKDILVILEAQPNGLEKVVLSALN